jgi:hypothetical protein
MLVREPQPKGTATDQGNAFFYGHHSGKKKIQIGVDSSTAGRRESKLVWALPWREEENPDLCGLFHGGKKKIQIGVGSSTAGRRESNLVWALPQREEENPNWCGLFHSVKKRIQNCAGSSMAGRRESKFAWLLPATEKINPEKLLGNNLKCVLAIWDVTGKKTNNYSALRKSPVEIFSEEPACRVGHTELL